MSRTKDGVAINYFCNETKTVHKEAITVISINNMVAVYFPLLNITKQFLASPRLLQYLHAQMYVPLAARSQQRVLDMCNNISILAK